MTEQSKKRSGTSLRLCVRLCTVHLLLDANRKTREGPVAMAEVLTLYPLQVRFIVRIFCLCFTAFIYFVSSGLSKVLRQLFEFIVCFVFSRLKHSERTPERCFKHVF